MDAFKFYKNFSKFFPYSCALLNRLERSVLLFSILSSISLSHDKLYASYLSQRSLTNLLNLYIDSQNISNGIENLKKEVEDSGWQNTGKDIATQYNEVVAKLRNEGINFDKLDELLEKKKSKINDLDKAIKLTK